MFRRPPKPESPFRDRQEELGRREAELRERLEQLERMIAETSRNTENASRLPRDKGRVKNNAADRQFRVSVASREERYSDETRIIRRPRFLRKQRREGRMVFLVLVLALVAAIIWLMSHLHF